LSFKPGSLNFGDKTIVGHASKAKKLQIENSSAKKSKIDVTISGETSTASAFTVTRMCDTTLAPKKKCEVQVKFTPPDTTLQTGQLIINDNATGSPQKIQLSGTGKAPKPPKK
jgi:hypothetical protein